MEHQLAIQEPSIAQLLAGVIEKGITADNVAALEKLCDLKLKVDAKTAEREFNAAFIELQKEIPQIKATKPVPNNDGTVRYKFAPLEEIDAQLRPIALRHGFTYSFSEGESDQNKVCKVCTVYHTGGHSRSNSFSVRKSAPPKSTDTQADGSTHTYAKRGALCDAYGIIIEHDDDARMIGKPITPDEADELRQRVRDLVAQKRVINEEAFLKFAGAAHYEAISHDRLTRLHELLDRKERGQMKRQDAPEGEYEW